MLFVAVCDDLPSDRLQIQSLIYDFCDRNNYEIHLLTFENGKDLVNYYQNQETFFDIIFLDIYMNGKTGIQAAKQIRKYDLNCKIIFITSSTTDALESFEVFPYNYITKPLSKSTFFISLTSLYKLINFSYIGTTCFACVRCNIISAISI